MFLAQRLSWFTLAQDGLLLVYAVLMIRAGLRARVTGPAAPVGPTVERAGTA